MQRLKNGLNAVGVAPIAGRVSGTILSAVADLAERAGSDRIRFTPYQKLVILDVPDDKLDDAGRRAGGAGAAVAAVALAPESDGVHAESSSASCHSPKPGAGRRLWCPSWRSRLEDINAQLDVPITVNINGCPNSCARIQVADIGFKGQMVDDGKGGSVEGFQVHLGGSLGLDSGFGRKLRQHKVHQRRAGRLHRPGGAQLRETTRATVSVSRSGQCERTRRT